MRLLLDTHAVLWWFDGSPLSNAARSAIQDPESSVFVSAATVWETAIKIALGKLRVDADLSQDIDEEGFDRMAITYDHAVAAGGLPLHHRDPFDRMLIAQAILEGLTIVTRDKAFDVYDVKVMKC